MNIKIENQWYKSVLKLKLLIDLYKSKRNLSVEELDQNL